MRMLGSIDTFASNTPDSMLDNTHRAGEDFMSEDGWNYSTAKVRLTVKHDQQNIYLTTTSLGTFHVK